MLGAAPSGRAQPLLSSGRSRGPFQHHGHASNTNGQLRQRRRGLESFTCRTLEADEAAVAGYGEAGGQGEAGWQGHPAKTAAATSETFQQLRKAVLSSLDFADNAEQTLDFEDVSDADQFDDISAEAPTAASVGRAVYEVGGRRRVGPAAAAADGPVQSSVA